MASTRLTLLIEDLHLLAACGLPGRYPALEAVLAKGSRQPSGHPRVDQLRFALTGFNSSGALPVAAVSRLAEPEESSLSGQENDHGGDYWLRADPVSLQLGMTQIVMTGAGCDDLYAEEQAELAQAVGDVIREEGMAFQAPARDRWYLRLKQSPGFDFPPLQDALGADAADVTPSHPEAAYWRKLMAEIQMVLHAHPVNDRRRDLGKNTINSVWFWGGGFAPEGPSVPGADRVYSDHPLSRGLAISGGIPLNSVSAVAELAADGVMPGKSVLVDWSLHGRDADQELSLIDELLAGLMPRVRSGKLELILVPGNGRQWSLNYRSARRFWKKSLPLANYAD